MTYVGRRSKKEGIYVYIQMADSLWGTADTDTAVESNYTPIFLKKIKSIGL